jgi:CrcB protein
MLHALLVAAGGALGALARYGVSLGMTRAAGPAFPWGTLLVNVAGCLVMGGLIPFLTGEGARLGERARLFLGVGVLGGFTTFSAFGLETWGLVARGRAGLAAVYVAASVVLGLGAVWLGRWIMIK